MKAKKLLLATPLLKWYLSHGMVVSDVYQVVEFTPKSCFKTFEEEVTLARRLGDDDPGKMIIADTMKLIGNSAYGSLIMDKEKHQTVKYVTSKRDACLAVNQPVFRKITELDELYEIESVKKRVSLNLPIYLGYFILQYAKLRMLEFYYDCLDVLVDRSDFEYMEMDTDSAYIAIAGMKLEDVIRPEKEHEYYDLLYNNCTDDESLLPPELWFQRKCCSRHKAYDKRTPGLFKLEAEGNEMIALSSKTYILQNEERCKLSCKGISHRALVEPMNLYKEVLNSQSAKSGTNKGFRSRNNTIYSYEQSRAGLTYFYCKREVLSDGVSTVPLNVTLSPWNITPFLCIHDRTHPLSPEYPSRVCVFGTCFSTAKEAYDFVLCSGNFGVGANGLEIKTKLNMVWMENRKDFMRSILIEKMRSNTEVRQILMQSKNLSLLYTVADRYWGVGMTSRLASVSSSHRGSNILGLLWEEIRELYHDEIYQDSTQICEFCSSQRSDASWRKEMGEILCSNCSWE